MDNTHIEPTATDASEYVLHATAADSKIRALAAVTTGIVDEVRARQNLLPTASAALGRTMTATAMLGAMLKGKEKVTVQVICNGPIEQIVADADAQGNLRGYVQNPCVHFPLNKAGKLDVKRAVGEGNLWVIRDLGLKEPYRGGVPLISGEIGEDFANYFARSEQTPSIVALGVLVEKDNSVRAAGGLILQLLPNAGEELTATLEQRAARIPAISRMVDSGKTPEELIHMIIGDLNPRPLKRLPLRFSCSCSRERYEAALISLGPEELQDMITEQGGAELVCRFCQEVYHFSRQELETLLKEAKNREEEKEKE